MAACILRARIGIFVGRSFDFPSAKATLHIKKIHNSMCDLRCLFDVTKIFIGIHARIFPVIETVSS